MLLILGTWKVTIEIQQRKSGLMEFTLQLVFCVICSKQCASIMSLFFGCITNQSPIPQHSKKLGKTLCDDFETLETLNPSSVNSLRRVLAHFFVCELTSTILHGKTLEFWIANHRPTKINPKQQA